MTASSLKRSDLDLETPANLSPLMTAAYTALGGAKHWTGDVRGLGGLIRRQFTIQSTGVYHDGEIIFRETLTFDDGEHNQREWSVIEREDGLHLQADTIRQIRPGRIQDGILILDYRLKLGRIWLPYRDLFVCKMRIQDRSCPVLSLLSWPCHQAPMGSQICPAYPRRIVA